jgi:hypothetical protein
MNKLKTVITLSFPFLSILYGASKYNTLSYFPLFLIFDGLINMSYTFGHIIAQYSLHQELLINFDISYMLFYFSIWSLHFFSSLTILLKQKYIYDRLTFNIVALAYFHSIIDMILKICMLIYLIRLRKIMTYTKNRYITKSIEI